MRDLAMSYRNYTEREDEVLMWLINVHRYRYKDVAEVLNRAIGSVAYRVQALRGQGFNILAAGKHGEPESQPENYKIKGVAESVKQDPQATRETLVEKLHDELQVERQEYVEAIDEQVVDDPEPVKDESLLSRYKLPIITTLVAMISLSALLAAIK